METSWEYHGNIYDDNALFLRKKEDRKTAWTPGRGRDDSIHFCVLATVSSFSNKQKECTGIGANDVAAGEGLLIRSAENEGRIK